MKGNLVPKIGLNYSNTQIYTDSATYRKQHQPTTLTYGRTQGLGCKLGQDYNRYPDRVIPPWGDDERIIGQEK